MSAVIHIGTSGWSYQDWKGIFYPEEMKPAGYLLFYAKEFGVTEINSSFYHLPQRKTVEGWIAKTPEGFLFCPKMSQYLTHIKKLQDPEEPLERFFAIFDRVKRRLGPVLIQLPPSLAFHPDPAAHLYHILKTTYREYTFAIEARHASWLSGESIALMRKFDISFAMSQSGGRYPYAEIITADHIYIRLHGPGRLYASSYPDDTLQQYADKIRGWVGEGRQVWVFFNNTMNGFALRNAQRLKQLLDV